MKELEKFVTSLPVGNAAKITIPKTLPLTNRTGDPITLDTGATLNPGESIMMRVAKDRMPGLVMHQSKKLGRFSMGCTSLKENSNG